MQLYLKSNNGIYEKLMDYVKQILQQANAFGSKSSILSVLAWIFGTLFVSITVAGVLGSPIWLLIGMFVLLVIVLISILVAFFYCLFTNKTDVLRSEKFNIEKLAIEKQTTSDSVTGIHTLQNQSSSNRAISYSESVQDDTNEA